VFEVFYDARAVRELEAMDNALARRMVRSIELKLTRSPQTYGKPLRGSLKGDWSLRVGDWRILCRIEAGKVIVSRIGHRREVYE